MWLMFTLVACLAFGIGAAMQKHGMSSKLPSLTLGRLFREWRMVFRIALTNWVWLLGIIIGLFGGILMVLAIDLGEISLVQPIVNLNILVAVMIGVIVLGERLSVREWTGAALMVGGAVILGAFASSDGQQGSAPSIDHVNISVIWLSVACAGVSALLVAVFHGSRSRMAIGIGTAGGLLFGLSTVHVKLLTMALGVLPAGASVAAAVVSHPATWGIVATNVIGFAFFQIALANGRVAIISPLNTIMAMVLPVTAGFLSFGEDFSGVRIIGILVVAFGTVMLLTGPQITAGRAQGGSADYAD